MIPTRRFPGILLLLALSAVLLVACSDDDGPTCPLDDGLYDLTGRALSHPGGAVIPGAVITTVTTGDEAVCDTDGVFHVAGLDEGSHQLVLTAPGHATTRYTLVLEATDPAKGLHVHQDIHAVEASASLVVPVYGDDGSQIRDATVVISRFLMPPELAGHAIDQEAGEITAVTDSTGNAHFTELPVLTVEFAVLPPDGSPWAAAADTIALRPAQPALVPVVLPFGSSAPTVVTTNLPDVDEDLVADTVLLVFSEPMDSSGAETVVTLRRTEEPFEVLPTTFAWTSAFQLEVTPWTPLKIPTAVTLEITARSGSGTAFHDQWGFSWMEEPGGGGLCADVVTDLAVAPEQAPLDAASHVIALQWTASPCADGYVIFARDDRNNPGWVQVGQLADDFETGTITHLLDLPAGFDRYLGDYMQTPLAGINVEACVVPANADEPAPGAPHPVLGLTDVVMPSIEAWGQTGSAVNTGSEPTNLGLLVVFSEFVDEATPPPVLVVEEAGGDPGYAIDPTAGTWDWLDGGKTGRLTFTLPAGADASGDRVRLEFRDLVDLSGNTRPGISSTSDLILAESVNFFDFDLSDQGWVRAGDGWEWGEPTIGPLGGHNSARCWGTDLSLPSGPYWDTYIESPPLLVTYEEPWFSFWSWFRMSAGDFFEVYFVDQDGNQTRLQHVTGSLSIWREQRIYVAGYVGQVVKVRFRFVSDSYTTDEGVFIDDVGFSAQ